MERIRSAVAVAIVMFLWTPAANADTTYIVTWRDTTFEKITSRFGVTRDELFGANPGKIRAMCYGVGEVRQTSWGRTRAKCWRMVPYPVAGEVLNIPSTRATMNIENQSLRTQRDQLTAEREDLRRQLDAEHQLRVEAEHDRAKVRHEIAYLATEIKKLKAKQAKSAPAAVAVGSAGTALVAIILALVVFFRERAKANIATSKATQKEERADAQILKMVEQERALSARELTLKDRETDIEARQAKAVRGVQAADRRLADLETQRQALETRERNLVAREGEVEQARLQQANLLTRKREEYDEAVEQTVQLRLETELRDVRAEREQLKSERAAMRQEIETSLRAEYDAREQRIQVGMNLVEGLDDARRRLEADQRALDGRRDELRAFAEHLAERERELDSHEEALHGRETLSGDPLPPPPDERPRRNPTLPATSPFAPQLADASNGTPGNAPERERTRIPTEPMMPAVIPPDTATAEATLDCIPDPDYSGQGGGGGNGSPLPLDSPEPDVEVTRRVLLPGLHEHEPSYTVTADGFTCDCGAGRIPEDKWEEHRRLGHLKCTYCTPAIVIQSGHRARHLRRMHPDVNDPRPLGRRRSRPPEEKKSGSGD